MRKIGLLVYDVSLIGGAEHIAINLANEIVKTDATYVISVFAEKECPYEISDHVICFTLSNRLGKIPLHFREYKAKLRKILIEEHIDILLAITAGMVTLAISASKGISTKVIYCEHSNLENRTYGWKHVLRQYYGAKRSDTIVTLTERDRQNFINYFKVPENKVRVIPNWYSFHSDNYHYDVDSKKIISVGRLEKIKGYEYVIEAAEVVLKNHPDWQWDIFGEGSLHYSLQRQINSKGIERLILQGNVNDISERYSHYSFLVMTSMFEGLPLSLLEAQASSLPIISFDCPTGPSEIIMNNVNGYIVPQNDVNKLVEKIQDLISNPKKRESFSRHSQDNLNHFEKTRIIYLWDSLFQDLVGNGGNTDE